MAIGRLSVKVGKAGKASPHAAYIARLGQYEKRLEKGEKLEASEFGNMPKWAASNPLHLWDAADAYERKNGTTYREFEIALPREMNLAQRLELVRDFVGQEIGDRHPYQFAIHTPTAADGGEQPHAHVMFCERERDGIERDPEQFFKRYNSKNPERGGAKKANTGKDPATRRTELKELRGRWETMCNEHLVRGGIDARIDMRSHAERGTGLAPEVKQLPSQWRDEQQRAEVIDFRAVRIEQQQTAANLAREIPDVGAEVVSLLAEHEQLAKPAPMPAADLVKAWDGRKAELYRGYRKRAERLESRVDQQIQSISTKRRNAEANHAKKCPVEPTGLLAVFKRSRYEKLMPEWHATAKRIKAWKVERENDLRKRLERVRRYLTPGGGFSMRDAERAIQKERPEWAARLPQARDEVQREKEAKKQEHLAQKRERQVLRKGRPGRGQGL